MANDLAQASHESAPIDCAPAPGNFGGDQHSADVRLVHVPTEGLLVKLYADLVDDLEKVRIATENRHRSLIQVKGLEGSPEEVRLLGMVDSLKKIERAAIRDLERSVAAHPVGGFVEKTPAIGLKTMGRLLGVIGDPTYYIDGQTGEVMPRTVSKLWAYCGYKPGQGKRAGQDHEYNHQAKMRAYIIAECCMKNRKSPYRPLYEEARAKYESRDLPDWRKHAMALRIVAKEVLKDLWKFRRDQCWLDAHLSGDTSNGAEPGSGRHPETDRPAPELEQAA